MSGTVEIDSTAGKGSTFTVSLTPQGRARGSAARHLLRPEGAMKDGAAQKREHFRVLVVDDHPVNREVLCASSICSGSRADSVVDGVEAWRPGRRAATTPCWPTSIMPRMDGYELTARSGEAENEGRRPGHTPIVAVTANAMKGEEERCIEGGHGCLSGQAGEHRAAAHHAGALALGRKRQGHASAGNGEAGSAIDRRCLAPRLGDDQAAIDSLLRKFEDTAADTQREIDSASRNGISRSSPRPRIS